MGKMGCVCVCVWGGGGEDFIQTGAGDRGRGRKGDVVRDQNLIKQVWAVIWLKKTGTSARVINKSTFKDTLRWEKG